MINRYVDTDVAVPGAGTLSDFSNAYASLASFQTNEATVSMTDDYKAFVKASSGSADTTLLNMNTWEDGTVYSITIDQQTYDPHGGSWNTSAYRLAVSNATAAIYCQTEAAHFLGLQIEQNYNSGSSRGIYWNTGLTSLNTSVRNCIIRRTGGTDTADSHAGINCEHSGTASDTIVLRNNIIYDFYCGILYKSRANDTCYIDNNTVADVTGSGYNYDLVGATDTFYLRNNIAFNCATPYNKSSSATTETITYNAYDSGTDPGTNGVSLSDVGANNFSNYASDDFHLISGSNAYSAGTDLSGTFTDDIDGDTRSLWSIGADDGIASGGGSQGAAMYAYAQQ